MNAWVTVTYIASYELNRQNQLHVDRLHFAQALSSSESRRYQTDSLAILSAKYAFPREKKKCLFRGGTEGEKKLGYI